MASIYAPASKPQKKLTLLSFQALLINIAEASTPESNRVSATIHIRGKSEKLYRSVEQLDTAGKKPEIVQTKQFSTESAKKPKP